MSKKVPIGISDFRTFFNENYYYVDKSLFIKDVIDDSSKVVLIPKPRCFGKTLNISMLKYFYKKTKEDNSFLFKGLKIQEHKEIMLKQGQYPVIYLTFKDERYSTWENCKKSLSMLISSFCHQVQYLLESKLLTSLEKQAFSRLINRESDIVELSKSLFDLSSFLYKHHKQKVIILIDEYDMPIKTGYINNYYKNIVEFIRNFLSDCLKNNEYLEKVVLTKVCSRISKPYSQYFGFLKNEVQEICRYYKIDATMDNGDNTVYNPRAILNFVKHPYRGYIP